MRINFFAGPCAGKSSLSPYIFSMLKRQHFNIEFAHEYIKDWAYLKRVPKGFDPVYIFAKQMHREDVPFQCGVEHVISDSPLLLSPIYSRKHGFRSWHRLLQLCQDYEEVHPSFNIFLDRTGIPYQQNGRYETEEQAKAMDKYMLDFLDEHDIKFVTLNANDPDTVLRVIYGFLTGKEKNAGTTA
jgi:hypothetical protein